MSACPSAQELEQFLDEELDDRRHEDVVKHVGACAACQSALERLTELAGELQSVAHGKGDRSTKVFADLPESGTAFLTHLKEFPPPALCQDATADTPNDKPALQEPLAVSGYEILGELGRGGMGVVYKARHVALDRVVALKMILAGNHAGPKDRERFRQEATAIARLHHPHIVQVFDIGDAGGRPYLALEYVKQGSLSQHLRGEPQPLPMILPLMETLARTMAYAHQCGIIHRDLKPANILLSANEEADGQRAISVGWAESSRPTRGVWWASKTRPTLPKSHAGRPLTYVPKITDFGLAKRLNEEGSRSSSEQVLGTPSYMAPEQADTKTREIGPATDVYALGAILYEMLTGRPPFKGATPIETMLQVLHQEPVRPGRLRPKLPRDIETICLKCLEKDPAHRYASASALADDLRRFRRGDPIEARPVGLFERGWKMARRRPVSAALVVGIVLVTLLGFTGVTWQWRVAVDERNDKDYQRQQARNALYYSRIAQSQLQWRVNDLPGALRSLEDCIPQLGDIHDRRGWEWYYLQALYRPELIALSHSRTGVEGSVAFDPTGRTITSVVSFPSDTEGERGEIRFWDSASGKLLFEQRLQSPCHRLAFRPDGKRLVLGGAQGTIRVWDAVTYRELWQGSVANGRMTALTFSPDGKTVATAALTATEAGRRGEIRLWDAETGTSKQLAGTTESSGFYCVAFHPTLPLLVAGDEDNLVRRWNLSDGKELHPLKGHKSAVNSVAFSPDGKLLVSAGNNGELKIWNLEQDNNAPQSLTGRTGAVLSLAFSPDSRYFAYCGTDKTVRVWDVDSGTGTITYRGHTALVESAQFSPDGQRLVSCSPAQGEVKVWDLTRHPEFSPLVRTTGDRDHPARDVENIAFHEDGQHLVSVTVVGELQVWDAISGVLHAQYSLPISAEPFDLGGILAAFAPNGRRLAARCRDDRRLVRIWDVDSGKELLTCRGHHLPVSCVRFSTDGRYLATCAGDEKPGGKPFEIKVWDAATGKLRADLHGNGRVMVVAFSPDGRLLAAGNDNRLRVFEWTSGREVHSSTGAGAPKNKISALAFSPDGALLASAGSNDEVHLWDSSAWDVAHRTNRLPLRSLASPQPLCDLAFSPDGKRLAGASRDLIKMWDVETGVEVLALRGAPQRYRDPPFNARVVFHTDGPRLAGTNWNESISVWDAPLFADKETRRPQEAARRQGADARALFWHLQEAEYCVEHKLMYGAQFHLQRLGEAQLPPLLQERLARIRTKLPEKGK